MKLRRIAAMALLLCTLIVPQTALAGSTAQPNTSVASYDSEQPESLIGDHLTAQSAVLLDARTGEVLFSKSPDTKLYPASITKILTALVVLDRAQIDDVVTVDLGKMGDLEATWLPLQNGEEYTVEVLLNGMLIRSFNDFAAALAVHVGGSLSGFADLMNQKAEQLGCADSHFETPHGLPSGDHYTTASDMGKIARAAMQNDVFRGIVSTAHYTVPSSNKRDEETEITNGNRMLPGVDEEFAYPGSIGVKTGYTNSAQHTFVGAVQRDGLQLICVILGSRGPDDAAAEGKWEDAKRLFDYAFATRESLDVAALYAASPTQVSVAGAIEGDSGLLNLTIADATPLVGITATREDAEAIRANFASHITVDYNAELAAPIEEGQIVGQLTFTTPSGIAVTCDLTASRAILAALPVPVSHGSNVDYNPNMPPTLTEITTSIENSPVRYLAWLLLIPVVLLIGLVISMVIDLNKTRVTRRRNTKTRNYSR